MKLNNHYIPIISYSFFVLGVLAIIWSVLCFIGGPDGQIGTKNSIIFGVVFLFAGIVAIIFSRKIINNVFKKLN